MNLFPTSSLLLKHQPELFEQILNKKIKLLQVLELLVLTVVSLSVFGGVMSISFPHWWHAMDVMWKLILLVVGTQLLCLPALFVFSSIRGSQVTLGQFSLFLTASTGTTAIVLLSLAPIAWFFTWSSNNNLDLIGLMNALMIGCVLLFGFTLLVRGLRASKSPVDILFVWLILVMVVTAQMAHKLEPWYIAS